MMKKKGICSVTFRNKTVEEVLELTLQNRLECIEWGGDIHVPCGDLILAKKVNHMCRERGVQLFSYGSYFRCLSPEGFSDLSKTAEALGVNIIRLWTGDKDAEEYSEEETKALVHTIQLCADEAKKRGQIIAFEYHYRTFSNSAENTRRLLDFVQRDNVKTYWQPMYWNQYSDTKEEEAANVASIQALREDIVGAHVYHWKGTTRLPLKEGTTLWKTYMSALPDCPMYMEFVADNREEAFIDDAACFLQL